MADPLPPKTSFLLEGLGKDLVIHDHLVWRVLVENMMTHKWLIINGTHQHLRAVYFAMKCDLKARKWMNKFTRFYKCNLRLVCYLQCF